LWGSAGPPCVRSGRGGNFSPAHQNRHISTGLVAGVRRSDDARNAVGRKHEEENSARLAGLGRGSRRHPVAAERTVKDWRKARQVSSGDQWVRPRTCPYRRQAAVGNAACQRHDRLPPGCGPAPPRADPSRSQTATDPRNQPLVSCKCCTEIPTLCQQKCFWLRGIHTTLSDVWDRAGTQNHCSRHRRFVTPG
jgi:hypothetical protein